MRKTLLSLLVIYVGSISCFGQVSFTGSAGSVSTGDDAATVVVDDAIVITPASTSIDGAGVYISSNFVKGDLLGFTNSLLPAGVSGSYNETTGILTFTGTAQASAFEPLLRSVTFTASANGIGDRAILFVLGSKFYYSGNNHFYEYVAYNSNPYLKWKDAKAYAASKTYYGRSGYLATITSQGENQFIQQIINSDSWIGGSDDYTEIKDGIGNSIYENQSASEGKFYWVTGPEAGNQFSEGHPNPVPKKDAGGIDRYMNWNSGEPTNSEAENYVHIYKAAGIEGKWNDLDNGGNSTTSGYVIEYGGLLSDAPDVITHSRTILVASATISTTPYKNSYTKNSSVIVDPAIVIKSGGLITDARITISGNFAAGDDISYQISRPTEITGSYFDGATGVFYFYGTAKPSVWQTLFRSITFQSNSASSDDRTITFSIGNMISGENGHFYEYVPATTSSWTAARDAASNRSYMGLQGYLATVTSLTENELISKKLSADGWLGGSDDVTVVSNAAIAAGRSYTAAEGNFYWVTGPEKGQAISFDNYSPQPVVGSYNNWYSGEPNNAGVENYIKMYSVSGALGTWNDMPLNSSVGMVVEYGGLNTDPTGLNLSASRVITNVQVLPVLGLKFQVKEKGSSVELNWSVLQEQNVKCYEILYSINGSSFRKIGTIEAKGNADHALYSYTDKNAVNGINYYKIVVVDEDGKKHYSDVGSTTIRGKLQLYPSVITDHFTVHQPNPLPGLLILTDVSGTKLLVKNINQGVYNLEVGFLPRGAYFVQVYYRDKERHVFKIIKH